MPISRQMVAIGQSTTVRPGEWTSSSETSRTATATARRSTPKVKAPTRAARETKGATAPEPVVKAAAGEVVAVAIRVAMAVAPEAAPANRTAATEAGATRGPRM